MPYHLLLLARIIDRRSARELQTYGLSLAEWRVLAFIGVAGSTSASMIGKAGEIDRAEISRAVRRLEGNGLVERRPDENHGKRFIISPTPAGEQLFRKVRDERLQSFKRMTKGLSEHDCTMIDKGLETIAGNLLED